MKHKHTGAGFGGKGYYIALILCAVAIGISGYLYYRNANTQEPQLQTPATGDQTPGGDDISVVAPQPGLQDPTVNTKPQLPDPGQAEPPKPWKTGKPVAGDVIHDYAMDCLSYNETTRDWRAHDGVDYAAEADEPVKAAADGTVYTVYEDDFFGMTVVIRHADGYVTCYSSLGEDVCVAPGDTVTLGQTIGYAGCSALLETAMGDHIHFSVTKNGASVDPQAFFALG